MSTNVGLLNEACNFKILNININDITIEPNYIQDLSIDWNGTFRIYGYCTINDHFDLVNTMLEAPGQELIITFIDNHDSVFARNFVVVNSIETKEQDNKSVTLKFQDVVSFTLQHTFVAKSYKEVDILTVFNDYMELEVNKKIEGFPLEIIEPINAMPVLKNFVIPLHMNFLSFIELEFEKHGIWFYQTRDNILIGDQYEPEETPKYPYTQAGQQDTYGFNIIEYSAAFNDVRIMDTIEKTDYIVFDKNTKSMTHYDEDLSTYIDVFSTNGVKGVNKNSQLTTGTQFMTKEYLINTNEYKHTDFKNNTKMSIIVPGNIDYSLLYKLVDVKITGLSITEDTRNTGDVRMSGKYQISRVEDKFILGQKFVQKLTLRRVNEGKNNVL